MVVNKNKRCSRCKKLKSMDKFYRQLATKDGRMSACRQCMQEWQHSQYESSSELREQTRQWNAAWQEKQRNINPGYSAKASRKWSMNNPERKKEHDRNYYLKNRAAILAKAKFKKPNPDKRKIVTRKYRQSHQEHIKEYNKNYRHRYPEKSRALTMKRLAAKRHASPSWTNTPEIKKAINIKYREAERLTKETGIKHSVDHIYPIRGIGYVGLHVPWNLQVIPSRENIQKSNKRPEEFYKNFNPLNPCKKLLIANPRYNIVEGSR